MSFSFLVPLAISLIAATLTASASEILHSPTLPPATPAPTPVDWSQFNDVLLLKVQRPAGNKIGNTICTGVLVGPRAVLTSAHCGDEAVEITAVFDVENGDHATKKETVPKNRIKIHPQYQVKKSFFLHDLSILFLVEDAPLSEKWIRKIPKKAVLKPGDRLVRMGVGLRNGINSRNFTDPIFVAVKPASVLETSDVKSSFGDSGGPIYNLKQELLAIHSTLENFDGKQVPHVYSVYLPYYKKWVNQELKKKGYGKLK